jgi:hypothetical protein
MVFAEMIYESEYEAVHHELCSHLLRSFKHVESGLQGDSWIWIHDGAERVAIDTFTAMKHQVKSPKTGPHVQAVIEVLLKKYKLRIYEQPELEAHED